jgi:hypothetical protein
MKGHVFRNTVAENVNALRPYLEARKEYAKHKQTCWQCQQDKHFKGGLIKTYPGLRKFVCADCLAANAARKEAAAQRTGGLLPEAMVK